MGTLLNAIVVIVVIVVFVLRAREANDRRTGSEGEHEAPDLPPLFTERQAPPAQDPAPFAEMPPVQEGFWPPPADLSEAADPAWEEPPVQPAADPAWEAPAGGLSQEKRLAQLQSLYESGIITKEELSAKRAQILRGR